MAQKIKFRVELTPKFFYPNFGTCYSAIVKHKAVLILWGACTLPDTWAILGYYTSWCENQFSHCNGFVLQHA